MSHECSRWNPRFYKSEHLIDRNCDWKKALQMGRTIKNLWKLSFLEILRNRYKKGFKETRLTSSSISMQQGSTQENNHLCAMFYLVLDHMSMRWLNGQETMVEPESYANLRCASLCRTLHWHVNMFFALFFCLSFEALGWSFVSFVSFASVRATPPVLSAWPWTIIIGWKKVKTCRFGSAK